VKNDVTDRFLAGACLTLLGISLFMPSKTKRQRKRIKNVTKFALSMLKGIEKNENEKSK